VGARAIGRLARRDLRHYARRHVLTGIGTALAVAAVVGAVASRASSDAGLEAAESATVQGAEIVVTAVGSSDARLPLDGLGGLRDLPGVARVRPVLSFPVRVNPIGSGGGTARHDRNVRLIAAGPGTGIDVPEVDGAPPTGPDQVALNPDVARALGVRPGGRVQLGGQTNAEVTVSGLLRDADQPLSRVPGAVTTIDLARRLDGTRRGWQFVLLDLEDGVDPADWLRAQTLRAPAGTTFQVADELVADARTVSAAVSGGLDMLAWSSVFMGCLLCFHLAQLSAVAGRRQHALLRTIGAGRRDLVAVEALTAAATTVPAIVVGCVLGNAAGMVVAPVIARTLGISPRPVPAPPVAYLLAAAAAVAITATSVVAGRRWTVPPLASLADDTDTRRPLGLPSLVAALVVAIVSAGVVLGASDHPVTRTAGSLVLVAASVVCVRNALLWWRGIGHRRRVRPGRAVPVLGRRAVARDAALAGTSVGLVMAAVAVLVAAVIGHQVTADAVDATLSRFTADFQVSSVEALPTDAPRRLDGVPGIDSFTLLGGGRATALDADATLHPVPFLAVDPVAYFEVADQMWSGSDRASVQRALARGGAAALNQPLADRLGVTTGETLFLHGPEGPVSFTVAGTFTSFAGDVVLVSRADAAAHLGTTAFYGALVVATPSRAGTLGEALQQAFPNATVEDTSRYRAEARTQLLSLFGIAYGALGLATLLCAVGLGASMSASVLRREHELRLLRSAGASRAQAAGMLAYESAVLVGLGVLGAVPLGWILSHALLSLTRRIVGVDLAAAVPISVLGTVPLVIVVLAAVATVLPARRVLRMPLVQG
jgi:putative ABC transport system permease protein